MQLLASLIRLLNGVLRLFRQKDTEVDKYQSAINGLNLATDKNANERKTELLKIAKVVFDNEKYKEITQVNAFESGLTWSQQQRKLFSLSNLSSEKMWYYISQIENDIMRMHGLVQLIEYCIINERVEKSEHYIEKLAGLKVSMFKDMRTLGYRKILNYYAELGDIENFKLYLKKSEPLKEKNEILRLKSKIISTCSISLGIEDAIKICKDKDFGINFLYSALSPYTEQVSFDKMQSLLNSKELESIGKEEKIQLLVDTYANELKKGKFNEQTFSELFSLIENIDPKIKNGDQKLRDWLFMKLGMYLTDLELMIKCRKAIGNNRLKQELNLVELKLSK